MGVDDDSGDCVEHVWTLRAVTLDLNLGWFDDYECGRCHLAMSWEPAT